MLDIVLQGAKWDENIEIYTHGSQYVRIIYYKQVLCILQFIFDFYYHNFAQHTI